VRLHADGVDDCVRPTPGGGIVRRLHQVDVAGDVDDVDAVPSHPIEPLGDEVDADHRLRAAVPGDPRGHVTDRAEAEHDDASTRRDRSVLDRLPGRRQDVGEVDEAVVG
jgi:hypothetical protein